MLSEHEVREVIGSTAYSSDGEKLGKVGQLFLDDQSGQPEFVTVNTGLFGTNESFIPVADASYSGDRLTVPFTKAKVKDAPNVDVDSGHLDHDQEQRLYQYYGLSYATTGTTGQETHQEGWQEGDQRHDHSSEAGIVGHDTSGPTTDDAMTRSEEQVRVGTASQERGRARLRKHVTTETETHTVPVTKERAVLETEPITDANAGQALDGPAISEEEHEVVLNEERAVVDKEAVPVERVRLGKETVTEQETVTEEVRKERIEAEGDVDRR